MAYCKASPDVCLFTFSSLCDSGIDSNYTRYRANQLESGLQKQFLQHGVLHSTWICVLIHLLNALLYRFLAIPFGVICYRKLPDTRLQKIAIICFMVIGIGSFVLAWVHAFGPLKLLAVSMGANGVCYAMCLAAGVKTEKLDHSADKLNL